MKTSYWEILSHIATFLSAIVSILAITIGVSQFRTSIKKTDEQIAYLRQERESAMQEGRPYLAIKDARYEVCQKNEVYGTAACPILLEIENIGIRPATNTEVLHEVICTKINDVGEMVYVRYNDGYVKARHYEHPNPVPKSTRFFYDFKHIRIQRKVLMCREVSIISKVTLKYTDKITDSIYNDTYYFKSSLKGDSVSLNKLNQYITEVSKKDLQFVDSLLSSGLDSVAYQYLARGAI